MWKCRQGGKGIDFPKKQFPRGLLLKRFEKSEKLHKVQRKWRTSTHCTKNEVFH